MLNSLQCESGQFYSRPEQWMGVMDVSTIKRKCPKCGAIFTIDESTDHSTCVWCGLNIPNELAKEFTIPPVAANVWTEHPLADEGESYESDTSRQTINETTATEKPIEVVSAYIKKRVGRSIQYAIVMGAVGFCLGFFGPILFGGVAQGPLLGIIFTGPLGFVLGGIIGAAMPVQDEATFSANNSLRTDRSDGKVAIWNPNIAAILSLVFTPAFGSYLQMLNWKTLQEPDKAVSSKIWFYISLGILIVQAVLRPTLDKQSAGGLISGGIELIFMLIWYYSSGRLQGKYVKEKLGSSYTHKPWGKLLLLVSVCTIGWSFWLFWTVGSIFIK